MVEAQSLRLIRLENSTYYDQVDLTVKSRERRRPRPNEVKAAPPPSEKTGVCDLTRNSSPLPHVDAKREKVPTRRLWK